jgi:hypothetical protein
MMRSCLARVIKAYGNQIWIFRSEYPNLSALLASHAWFSMITLSARIDLDM